MSAVSIATLTYNRPKLVVRAIESVLAQSFKDFEYIIINNASTDNTHEILEKYARMDKRIRILTNPENTILRGARNEGGSFESLLSLYSSPFYMSVNDDDFMEPDTMDTLYRLINEYDADIATVGSRWIYPDGTLKDKFVFDGIYVYDRIEAMRELLKREKFNAASGGKMYRFSVYKGVITPAVKSGGNRDINREYRIINNIRKIVVTGKPMFYFGRFGGNMSGLDTKEQITPVKMGQHLEANANRTRWLTENMPEIADYAFYSELSFMISLYDRIHRLEVEPCFGVAEEMKQMLSASAQFLFGCGYLTERELSILANIPITKDDIK